MLGSGLQPWLLFRAGCCFAAEVQRQLGSQISMFQVFCEIG
jgi:hypothetical protein